MDILNMHIPSEENITFDITDIQGRTVRNGIKISATGSIYVDDLAPGTYVLRYTKEDRTQGNVRFIKQ